MRRRRKHHVHWIIWLILIWGILFIMAGIVDIFHAIGWIALTALISGATYYAGLRGIGPRTMIRRIRKRDITAMDINSAYPDNLPESGDTGNWQRADTARDKILSDPRSGAKPLFRDGR